MKAKFKLVQVAVTLACAMTLPLLAAEGDNTTPRRQAQTPNRNTNLITANQTRALGKMVKASDVLGNNIENLQNDH